MKSAISELQEQERLLRMEYEEEKRSFSEATARVGLKRLAERGNAWMSIKFTRLYYNSLNQRIIEIERNNCDAEETDGKDHNFEYGKPVAFFTISDSDDKPQFPFTGTVNMVDGRRMAVAVAESAEAGKLEKGGLTAGVILSFDETSYRTMFEALSRTMKAKGRLGELRDLLYSRRPAGFLAFDPLGFPYLNASQEKAVNMVVRSKDVAIVHGPPGTGKTTTLVEAVCETLKRESQVMVCAQSNMAVDWICEKLTDRGVHVLRIGNPSRVNDKMLGFTYERRFEAHPDYPDLWSLRKAIRELRGAKRRNSEQWHQKMDRLRSQATELEIRINGDLFNSARVVASTLVGSASRLLEGMKFPTVFIDEAAQALEAASLIPLRRAGRIVLAGDHCQLPPTVKSYEAMKAGLSRSLMERIVECHPEAVSLLTVQYRMNEEIMRFSSDWFYAGAMTAAPEVSGRGILDLDIPMEWIDTSEAVLPAAEGEEEPLSFRESLAGESYGRVNRGEAEYALRQLRAYIEKIGKRRILEDRIDFALISPYRAQVHYLRALLKRTPFFRPYRPVIAVNTVDGFQGQERDVVMISLVRSNEEGNLGFLRDLRRMNVAMTRARMKLIIIGDRATLGSHPFYRKLQAHIERLSKEKN